MIKCKILREYNRKELENAVEGLLNEISSDNTKSLLSIQYSVAGFVDRSDYTTEYSVMVVYSITN